MKSILTIGEILVEIMATEKGDRFLEPISLIGPFPSGAPAIFIDQAAKFGQAAAIIGCVGNDDFGRVNLDRLRRDGVDVEGVRIDPEMATGSAFVRYRPDGSRAFVYNIKHSAAGAISLDAAAKAVLNRSDHLHVMGTALSSPNIVEVILAAAEAIKARAALFFRPEFAPRNSEPARPSRGLRNLIPTLRSFPAERRRALSVHEGKRRESRGPGNPRPRRSGDRSQARRRRRQLFQLRGAAHAGWVRGQGGRSNRSGRLLRRHLRQLLAAQHASGPVSGLCRGERSLGGHAAGTDGGRRKPS